MGAQNQASPAQRCSTDLLPLFSEGEYAILMYSFAIETFFSSSGLCFVVMRAGGILLSDPLDDILVAFGQLIVS